MKKVLILFVILAVNAVAQEAKPVETASLKLERVEVQEWQIIQLLGERLNAEYKIKEYNEKMADLNKQVTDLNRRVLESRKLAANDWQPNWQAGIPQVVKKPVEAAKK